MSASSESYRAVVTRLAAAQKSHVNAPAYSRWVNRPLGRRIAAAAYLCGLTPNQVTAISAVFTFSGILALILLPPTPVLGIAVSAALVAGYAVDSADGQLARLRGGGSALGEWLDHVVDSVKNIAVHLAVAVSWFRFDPDLGALTGGTGTNVGWLLAVPLLYAVVSSTFFFAMTLTDQLRRQGRTARSAPKPRADLEPEAAPVLPSLLTLPNDFGLLIVVFATVGLPAVFAPAYTLLLAANLAFLAVGLRRWSAELRQGPVDR
jgi:phosphatidylglycerophosphate synthase